MNEHILKITDLNIADINTIFKLASYKDEITEQYKNIMNQKILCSLFFQQSTRTQLSFHSAFIKLGGNVIGFSDIECTRSSAPYFEDASDLGKIISNYADIAVMRTESKELLNRFVQNTTIPVISGGCEHEAHPTQALIDVFTMTEFIKNIHGINILILGSLNHRAIKSLINCLAFWNDISLHIISDCMDVKKLPNIKYSFYSSLTEFMNNDSRVKKIDVIYVTRFLTRSKDEKKNILTKEKVNKFRQNTIILDPLPRSILLPYELDSVSNSKYFMQAKNGLYVREALFIYLYQSGLL